MLHRYKGWLDGFTPIDNVDGPKTKVVNGDKNALCEQYATHMMVRATAYDPE